MGGPASTRAAGAPSRGCADGRARFHAGRWCNASLPSSLKELRWTRHWTRRWTSRPTATGRALICCVAVAAPRRGALRRARCLRSGWQYRLRTTNLGHSLGWEMLSQMSN